MNWLKKIINRLSPASPRKSEPVSPPTDPLSQAVPGIWSRAFSDFLTEESTLVSLSKSIENLRVVPSRLREPEEPITPASSGVTVATLPFPPRPGAAAPPPSPEPAMMNNAQAVPPPKRTDLTGGGYMHQAADEIGPYEARFDRKHRLRSFTRTDRFKEVFGKPIAETRIWIYDPQADELLDKESEEYMREQIEQYGAEAYLTTLCERHGVNPHPWPPSEYEFVRSIRKLVRGLKIYEGERFIQ